MTEEQDPMPHTEYRTVDGMCLVNRDLTGRDEEAAGSNPVTPTRKLQVTGYLCDR
jgi:hypothetical protein